MDSKQKLEAIITEKKVKIARQKADAEIALIQGCNLLHQRMQYMANNPQEFNGRISDFGTSGGYRSYPLVSQCPNVQRFLDDNAKTNPCIKFDTSRPRYSFLSDCRTLIDLENGTLTYILK